MIWVKILLTALLASLVLFVTNPIFAEESNEETSTEEFFQSLDKDKDGKICREEWEVVDKDKDNTICKEEWKRWEFKSEPKEKSKKFDIKWYDNNGDGFMDQEEFYRYPGRRH